MKCIIVVAQYPNQVEAANYTYSDFEFGDHKAGPGDSGRAEPGYCPTADVENHLPHMIAVRRADRWAVVEVEVDEADLAFSDEFKGGGERMYCYPYSKWVRDVDFGDKHISLQDALDQKGCTLLSQGEMTPEMRKALQLQDLKKDLEDEERDLVLLRAECDDLEFRVEGLKAAIAVQEAA